MIENSHLVGDLTAAKRKRQKRYEEKTLNKPCTVRAHPNKHNLIKKFAKTGHCNSCKENIDLTVRLKKIVIRQKNGPIKWTDQCTYRDAVLSSISASFVVVVFILYCVVNRIIM